METFNANVEEKWPFRVFHEHHLIVETDELTSLASYASASEERALQSSGVAFRAYLLSPLNNGDEVRLIMRQAVEKVSGVYSSLAEHDLANGREETATHRSACAEQLLHLIGLENPEATELCARLTPANLPNPA